MCGLSLNNLSGKADQLHTLLKRVYQADSLACPCGGRLRFNALVTEPETAKEILRLGLPTDLPPIARARSPNFH
jgi:hypothetical protein